MTIEIIDILYLPMIFFIGVVTSWEDYKIGKIRNKWIMFGFFYGLFVLIIFFLWAFFGGYLINNFSLLKHFLLDSLGEYIIIPTGYLIYVILNSSLAILISFLLWRFGLMSAGDAKLFFIFSWLLPLKYYWQTYFNLFPSLVLLINIYIPIFVILFLNALAQQINQLYKSLDRVYNINWQKFNKHFAMIIIQFNKQLISFFSLMIIVLAIRNKINPWLPTGMNNSVLFLVFLAFRRFIYKVFKKHKLIYILVATAAVIQVVNMLSYGFVATLDSLKSILKLTLGYYILFTVLNKTLDNYINEKTVKKIKIKNLKIGMVPRLNKKPNLQIGLIKGGGITLDQIKDLKEWGNHNKFKEIEIYQRSPFAIWIFFGVIITIIFQGSVFHLIINYLSGK